MGGSATQIPSPRRIRGPRGREEGGRGALALRCGEPDAGGAAQARRAFAFRKRLSLAAPRRLRRRRRSRPRSRRRRSWSCPGSRAGKQARRRRGGPWQRIGRGGGGGWQAVPAALGERLRGVGAPGERCPLHACGPSPAPASRRHEERRADPAGGRT